MASHHHQHQPQQQQGPMEEGGGNPQSGKGASLEELSLEGQRHLLATVEAAHQILSSMNEVLSNPSIWQLHPNPNPVPNPNPNLNPAPNPNPNPGPGQSHHLPADGTTQQHQVKEHQELGWSILDESRLRFKAAAGALRSLIHAIHNNMEEVDLEGKPREKVVTVETEKLQLRVSSLKEEVRRKNEILKLLIDQTRDLVGDIAMWQTPYL